ncbi:hypothetical protein [Mycobacterium sp.]|jgi:hypothetical protein|uniref:hypothetical protein n=1 Tax=Mycobacterium sp. TaxID=1785 RepID=UPI00261E6F4A|nr:hypothetical protein [Mycobacterium sp.]
MISEFPNTAGTTSPLPADATASGGGKSAQLEVPVRALAGGDAVNDDIVDEWGRQSFPASDPPANW